MNSPNMAAMIPNMQLASAVIALRLKSLVAISPATMPIIRNGINPISLMSAHVIRLKFTGNSLTDFVANLAAKKHVKIYTAL